MRTDGIEGFASWRTQPLPAPPPKQPPSRVCRDCGHALAACNPTDRCFCCHEKRIQASLPPPMSMEQLKREQHEQPLGRQRKGGTLEVEGIKLTRAMLPGRVGPGMWAVVLKAFLESGEDCMMLEGKTRGASMATSLREAISVNGQKDRCNAVVRQGHCYLVRTKK